METQEEEIYGLMKNYLKLSDEYSILQMKSDKLNLDFCILVDEIDLLNKKYNELYINCDFENSNYFETKREMYRINLIQIAVNKEIDIYRKELYDIGEQIEITLLEIDKTSDEITALTEMSKYYFDEYIPYYMEQYEFEIKLNKDLETKNTTTKKGVIKV